MNEIKILALADIDDLHWKHGEGQADVLLSCGDISDQVILEASESYGCSLILGVKGNHDSNTPFAAPIMGLHLNVIQFGGMKFAGLNGSWKYKPRGQFLYDQREVQGLLSDFPPVDIFLSHNSPRGIHDREDGVHCGFTGLKTYIIGTQPKIVIHGHQHVSSEFQLGETRIIGVYEYKLIVI